MVDGGMQSDQLDKEMNNNIHAKKWLVPNCFRTKKNSREQNREGERGRGKEGERERKGWKGKKNPNRSWTSCRKWW